MLRRDTRQEHLPPHLREKNFGCDTAGASIYAINTSTDTLIHYELTSKNNLITPSIDNVGEQKRGGALTVETREIGNWVDSSQKGKIASSAHRGTKSTPAG